MSSIVTFYSYKGGVGRSMALANIATLLAMRGLRVLIVDWDLEAPGLDRYFRDFASRDLTQQPGLLDFLLDTREMPAGEIQERLTRYVSAVAFPDGAALTIMTAGRQDAEYARKVLDFDWKVFFAESGGGELVERLRDIWRAKYDVTLVDSRTGITDTGGLCTILLPDILVPVFTTNEQSLLGARDVAERSQRARQQLSVDRMPLLVFPLVSRYDGRVEFEEGQKWLQRTATEFAAYYDDWLPTSHTPLQMIERTKLPYVAYFSFGERLPVLTEGSSDPESLTFAYSAAATLLATEFADARRLLARSEDGAPALDQRKDYAVQSRSFRFINFSFSAEGMTVIGPDAGDINYVHVGESTQHDWAIVHETLSEGAAKQSSRLVRNTLARVGASLLDRISKIFPDDPDGLVREMRFADVGLSTMLGFDAVQNVEAALTPWELLYDKSRESFIALDRATPIVRTARSPRGTLRLVSHEAMRVLRIARRLDRPERTSAVDPAVSVRTMAHATLSQFHRALRSARYSAVQIDLQMSLDEEFDPKLLFRGDDGTTELVGAERLGVLLRDQGINTVVLNSVDQGTLGEAYRQRAASALFAATFLLTGIPAVIAVQFPMTDGEAFFDEVYSRLSTGFDIVSAVSEARIATFALSDLPDWASPMLYVSETIVGALTTGNIAGSSDPT